MFTPTNIIMNWIFVHVGFSVYPENSGNQWTKPPMMAKTAPIEST